MNIVVSSTESWNLGDQLIRIGALKVFESIYGSNHRYFLFNRNPDVNNKPNLVGNYLTINEIRTTPIDVLLIAGSPDWYSNSYMHLFPIIKERNIPVIALGIGSPFQYISLNTLEQEIYNRNNTMVIARDYNVQKYLPKAITLPCPAFFCADEKHSQMNKQGTGYIVQCNKTINQSSKIDFSEKKNDANLITIYKDEAIFFHKSVYSFDVHHLLNNISKYEKIISTRLHGVIGALSSGTQACLITDPQNARIIETQKPFGTLLPIVHDKKDLSGVVYPSKEQILEFKDKTWNQYQQVDWLKL